MAKIDKSNLISNPVFYAPQAPIQEGAETKSEILYANKFSGLDQVAMSGELLELFTSKELNLTDTNFRLQLQHILEEYDSENGPWYIEGHNEVIHIHNRKIGPSSFVYRYQDENGEVLKVQVLTNWTTGTTSGTLASTISRNKVRDITRLDLPALDITEPEENFDQTRRIRRGRAIWLDTDAVGSNIPGFQHDMYQLTSTDEEGRTINHGVGRASQASDFISLYPGGKATPIESGREKMLRDQMEWNNWQASNQQILDDHQAGKNTSRENQDKHFSNLVSNPSLEIDKWHDKILEEAQKSIGANSKEMGDEVKRVYTKLYKGEALTPLEQEIADRQIYLDNPDMVATFGKVHVARTFKRGNLKANPTSRETFSTTTESGGTYTKSFGRPGLVISALTLDDFEKQLKAKGVTETYVDYGPNGTKRDVRANREVLENVNIAINSARSSSLKNGGASATIGKITMTVNPNGTYDVQVTAAGTYTPIITMTDYAHFRQKRDTPGVGGSKRARVLAMVNAMRNRAKKTKHKEIEVQMVIIGRPSIEAGQYIDIQNIGQKYSGQWYIKTCVHQLDSNGYTCSLTLKRNQNTESGSAVSVSRKPNDANVTQGNLYPVETGQGIIYLSAADLGYANELALKGQQRSMARFVRTALYAQQQGTYGEGLKRVSNMGNVRMDGSENPDLQYADTEQGKAATEAYNQAVQAKRDSAKGSNKVLEMRQKAKQLRKGK